MKTKKVVIKEEKPTLVNAPTYQEEAPKVEPVVKIAPFSGDFGREDLNKLMDKINEVVDFINKQ